MPIIKSAIKKLRKDRKREKINRAKKANLKEAIKKARKSKKAANVQKAVSLIDKAVKTHLLHKNKAARLKSALAKLAIAKRGGKPPAKSRGKTRESRRKQKPLPQKES